MRLLLLLILALAPALARQEKHEEPASSHSDEDQHGGMEGWKWANFLVLAAGLGYLAVKHGSPFFTARSRQIRTAMAEAEDMRRDAEQRAAEVEARMANLGVEIESLRREAEAERAAETERLRGRAAAEIAKIQSHSQAEKKAAETAARMELRRHAAELAIRLAEQKIRARMTPGAQDALLETVLADLDRPASRAG